jgi:hypothetical protein
MTDIQAPDFERFPKLRDALAAAQVAEMEPGDALFYPAMWWHQVEALERFNVMINYWWNTTPSYMDTPQNTLLHALLSLRDRPESEKQAWRAMFEYYVFGPAGKAAAHLPKPRAAISRPWMRPRPAAARPTTAATQSLMVQSVHGQSIKRVVIAGGARPDGLRRRRFRSNSARCSTSHWLNPKKSARLASAKRPFRRFALFTRCWISTSASSCGHASNFQTRHRIRGLGALRRSLYPRVR